jgi:hypothetical protein
MNLNNICLELNHLKISLKFYWNYNSRVLSEFFIQKYLITMIKRQELELVAVVSI